ncbi:MAG: tRNA (guanine-N2)-dimethyltransferase [Gammaproteobacteria bacterium]|nr:MAG: tRNA (guanine-N2)-dimethyltransferase [Gammaproteobacteria bacterium]
MEVEEVLERLKGEEYLVEPQRLRKLVEVLLKRQKDLVVFSENVKNEHNFSAIIRTCDAVGVLNIYYTYDGNKTKIYNEHITMGSHKWVFLHRVEDAVLTLEEFKKKGFQVVATRLSPDSVCFREIDYTKPTVVVVGNELKGVSEEVSQIADINVIIPMYGMAQSLNVSVATAVILYEAQRQRSQKGMYNKPQLTVEEIKKILKKWAYEDIIEDRKRV